MKVHQLILSFIQFFLAVIFFAFFRQLDQGMSIIIAFVYLGLSLFYFFLPKFNETSWSMLIFSLGVSLTVPLIYAFQFGTASNELEKLGVIILNIVSSVEIYLLMNFFYRRDFINSDLDGIEDLTQILKKTRTNQGDSILAMSRTKPVLLVFIRHFGCTFCRENVAEISSIEKQINQLGHSLVFVHMSDPSFGDEFFARYFDHPVVHIADPSRRIFKAFGLRRGNLRQVFGPMTWIRGLWAGLIKGHGLGEVEGDSLQLGGYFLIKDEQVVFKHYYQAASEKFSLKDLVVI